MEGEHSQFETSGARSQASLFLEQCHRYRLCFDQTNRNRMREKVTAMTLFKGRKVSYRGSVSHPFRGDYIRLRKNAKWKRMAANLGEMYVVFADLVSKITKRCGKFVPKLVVVSTNSFLILDHRTMQVNHHIRLNQIYRLCASPYADNILVVSVHGVSCGLSDSFHYLLSSRIRKALHLRKLSYSRHRISSNWSPSCIWWHRMLWGEVQRLRFTTSKLKPSKTMF